MYRLQNIAVGVSAFSAFLASFLSPGDLLLLALCALHHHSWGSQQRGLPGQLPLCRAGMDQGAVPG